MRAKTMKNVMTGFRVSGFYPLDRNKLSPVTVVPLINQTRLAYIPMLSPAPHAKMCPDVPTFSDKELQISGKAQR